MYDVAITGASIAGAATAIHLARRGRSVIVLDRDTFPRRKACGEGLFPGGVRELESLGVLGDLAGNGAPLEAIRFRAGHDVAEAPLGGLGIARNLLDGALLAAAKREGVEVQTGVAVKRFELRERRIRALVTSGGEVEARAFVAADGLHSRLRRLARLDVPRPGNRYGVSAHVRFPGPLPPAVDVTFGERCELYITPVDRELANVALLVYRDEMPRFAGRLAEAYAETIAAHPALTGAAIVDTPRVAGPFPRACRRTWRGNLVLAGDAAGFVDGISGEGMSAALQGAPPCAAAVDRYLATGSYDPFRQYDRERRALVRNSNALARLSVLMAGREWTARLAVRNLARRPETFARLVAMNTGDASLSSLRPRDISALLLGV